MPRIIKRENNGSSLSWVEKYRPSSLSEIRGNEKQIETLQRFSLNPMSMPHVLLAGPAGTGKTSAAHALANDINATHEEMNASDERGIEIVQTKVKEYITTVSLDENPYKILILDESDSMTAPAQNAMRRMMERTRSCKLFFIANDMEKIIKPIRDRCAQIIFDPIPDEDIMFTLGKVLEAEGYEMSEDAGNLIVRRAMGSLRSAINSLQMICDGGDASVPDERVHDILQTTEALDASAIVIPALQGNFSDAKMEYVSRFKGYAGANDFVEMVTRDMIQGKYRDHESKIAKTLSLLRMGQGSNDYLQVLGFLARLSE